jgi:hypothetical protein
MLSYYTFATKTVKWWKKLFFHLFNLAVVNAHILHNKSIKEKMSLENFNEKVAEGLLASADTEIRDLGQTSSPAWLGPTIFYIEFQRRMLSQREKPSVRAERGKHQTGKTVTKFTTTYCRKCDRLCIGQCFEVYHSKLNYWK